MARPATRLAIVVSHPIQYVVPLYQRLATRADIEIKVFYTWHAGEEPVEDRGFGTRFTWDIPLTSGYDFERVANISTDPGTHHFFGLRNPGLVDAVLAWRPDIVLVNGWAWSSHLKALRDFARRGVRTLFRGDSHLLDENPATPRARAKRAVLRRVFRWPTGFLTAGSANRAYYEHFGVDRRRLFACPHAVELGRFAEPAAALQQEASRWRRQLGIAPDQTVLLFAGKFEPKKRPVELMRIVSGLRDADIILVLVGGGELQPEIDALAAAEPWCFRVVSFQNQTRMPVAYRLGDIFLLPSGYGESWGLAVNEAMSCGLPVIVSDRVGCAADIVDPSCGRVFPSVDLDKLKRAIVELATDPDKRASMSEAALRRSRSFDIPMAEAGLIAAVQQLCQAKAPP